MLVPGVLSGINQLRATIESRSEALTERVEDIIVFKIKRLIVEANVETKERLKADLAIQLGQMANKKLSDGKFRLKSRGSGSVPKEMTEEEDDDEDDVDGRQAIHDAESDKHANRAGSAEGFQKYRRSWIVFGTIQILQEQKITSSKTGNRNAFAVVVWSALCLMIRPRRIVMIKNCD